MKSKVIPDYFLIKVIGCAGGPAGSPGIPPRLIDPKETKKDEIVSNCEIPHYLTKAIKGGTGGPGGSPSLPGRMKSVDIATATSKKTAKK
ncbi:hypothetical protein [Pseudoalteromonas rubra]|uniref:Uncharacterized protein n=1 Tax=Pseudoalteromonas rubra TaxID=43658 RepID=A0A0F4QKR1_9GAMM|nr:hypothetical protein [Pseudoalteromonas rubra]KJZ07904.1 hypothetical protein TW77_13610 [Pseudoalteromonas rubra]